MPYGQIAHAPRSLAADGHSMSMQEHAVSDGDVFASEGPAWQRPSGLDGDVVVSNVNPAVGDAYPAAHARINAIGVWRMGRGHDRHVFDDHVLALHRHQVKTG